MDWWRDNFWIILAVAIIIISVVLGLILFCICRRLLRQGNGHLTWAGGGVHSGSFRARLVPGLNGLNFGLSLVHSGFQRKPCH